jgi:uncharacterized protein (UPF0332 family)
MKGIWDRIKTVALTIGVLIPLATALYYGFNLDSRAHKTIESRIKADEIHETFDFNKAYGEYILDSIEEVHTKQWRREQEVKDSIAFKRLYDMDSLLRLNIFLTSKGVKQNDTINTNIKNTNRNIQHTLDHVD